MILVIETGQEGNCIVRESVSLTAIRKEPEIPRVSVNVTTHSWPKKMFLKVFNLPNFRYNQRVTVAVRYEIRTFSRRVSIISFINVSIINLLLTFYS